MRKRVRGFLRTALLLAVAALAVFLGLGADFRGGNRVVVAADEIFEGDLYVAGSSVAVKGTVNGDLIAAAGTVTITGVVKGDLIAAAGTVTVDGTIEGSLNVIGATVEMGGTVERTVRMLGGSLSVDGEVARDVAVASGSFHLGERGRVGGDVVLRGGGATLDGVIAGAVTGAGSDLAIGGTLGGPTKIDVSRLTLKRTANIRSDLIYTSDNEAFVETGATVLGETRHNIPRKAPAAPVRSESFWPGFAQLALIFFMQLVVGAALVGLFPKMATTFADSLAAFPWHSLAWGLVFLITGVVLSIVLIFTIIGAQLGLISLAYYLTVVLVLSQLVVALWAGRLIVKIARRGAQPTRGWPLFAALAVGLLLVTAISALPFPYMRPGVIGVTMLFGIGGLWIGQRTIYRQLKSAGMV